MMKNEKNEFRKEFDEEFKNSSYVAKKTIWFFVRWILVIVVVFSIFGFGIRYFSINADYFIFKNSTSHVEGKIDDLSDYKLQIEKTDSAVEKAAIAETVVRQFSNFDDSKIQDDDLRQFLKDCRNGKYIVK